MNNIKKIIALEVIPGKVFINLNTLRYYTCTMIIKSEFEKDWVQIDKKDVEKFIAEQKTQISNSETPVETTEVKTE